MQRGCKFCTLKKMKLHRFIESIKNEINKYNIRYRELSEFSGFSTHKIKRFFTGKQRVTLEEFDILITALISVKARRGIIVNLDTIQSDLEYLDKIYLKNKVTMCDEPQEKNIIDEQKTINAEVIRTLLKERKKI
ncbi:hypothetical protein [Leminorella grimontii]|uniref:hypothetical protein n=1 Tax=Leminorella grimontii TaxID=82981 RepID=UPI00207DE224|nr:hypothetical protein [Leminorella grimontii]GKX58334.1 hypothetical protein SOASR031_06490 [Leminorella grimontii]